MLTRITLLIVVTAFLCAAAFTLGGMSWAAQKDSGQIPAEHPVMLALSHQKELDLTSDQVEKLSQLRDQMAKEFGPLWDQAQSVQQRMQELQASGKQDPESTQKLQKEGDEVGANVRQLFERYAHSAGELLSDDQRQKLMKLSEANGHQPEGQDFKLMFMMQSRDQLGITPQQFTKLQFLQADFIKEFAPLREQMDLLQIEVQDKFGKTGTQPPAEYQQRGASIQQKVQELQGQFSDRAVNEVLNDSQKTKLEELLHGEHPAAPSGK